MSIGKTTGITDIAFVVNEGTPGTLTVPAGTDVVRLVADLNLQQNKMTADSLERVNSYSIVDIMSLRFGPGTFNLQGYAKRTGTVDTAVPWVDTILTNALGIKTTNAAVNITYSLLTPSTVLKNFSMFTRKGNMFFQPNGCFVKELTLDFKATPDEGEIFRISASGEFYQLRWVGYTTITEDLTTTDAGLTKFKVATADLTPYDHATVVVDVAGKFTIGSYVMCGALSTSHKITAINPTTGVVTVTPAFGSNQVSGSVVKGYLPTETDAGTAIAAHKGLVTYGGADFASVLSGSIKLTNNRRTLVEEKNNRDYPSSDAWEGKRSVMLDTFRAYFDPNGTPQQDLFRALAHQLTRSAVVINIGNATGYKFQINLPQAITQEPQLVGDGIVELTMKQRAVASASLNDELNIVSF